jgi:hypothetical protein
MVVFFPVSFSAPLSAAPSPRRHSVCVIDTWYCVGGTCKAFTEKSGRRESIAQFQEAIFRSKSTLYTSYLVDFIEIGQVLTQSILDLASLEANFCQPLI